MFEVKLTIEPHEDGVHCGECRQNVMSDLWLGEHRCYAFSLALLASNYLGTKAERCVACLEAERRRKGDNDV